MIDPKKIELGGKTYILSKFPATVGRKIITQYVVTGLPKMGDYGENEKLMQLLMSYVAVELESGPLMLSNQALIDNHVKDWESLVEIELMMMDHNSNFFRDGRAATFLNGIAQNIKQWISQTLMDSSVRSSPASSPPLTS